MRATECALEFLASQVARYKGENLTNCLTMANILMRLRMIYYNDKRDKTRIK